MWAGGRLGAGSAPPCTVPAPCVRVTAAPLLLPTLVAQVQTWIVRAIGAKLLEGKIDQVGRIGGCVGVGGICGSGTGFHKPQPSPEAL